MAKVKVGIVEDEMLIAMGLQDTLVQLGYDTSEPAASYTEALGMIAEEGPDILLIDIQLSGKKDGIDLAMKLRETSTIPYIFLTANSDAATVARAKSAFPSAYLVKPFSRDDLYTSIEVCLHNAAAALATAPVDHLPEGRDNYLIRNSLFIKQSQHFRKVLLDDILFLESENVYVQLHTRQGKMLVRSSIQQYIKVLGADRFARVHRSYAVNIHLIDSITADSIIIGDKNIPLAKVYRDELLQRLKLG